VGEEHEDEQEAVGHCQDDEKVGRHDLARRVRRADRSTDTIDQSVSIVSRNINCRNENGLFSTDRFLNSATTRGSRRRLTVRVHISADSMTSRPANATEHSEASHVGKWCDCDSVAIPGVRRTSVSSVRRTVVGKIATFFFRCNDCTRILELHRLGGDAWNRTPSGLVRFSAAIEVSS
jgi:hypothetical protein